MSSGLVFTISQGRILYAHWFSDSRLLVRTVFPHDLVTPSLYNMVTNFELNFLGRPVRNMKKFEEGVFSDLRNLKPGTDACLEEPKVCTFVVAIFRFRFSTASHFLPSDNVTLFSSDIRPSRCGCLILRPVIRTE